MTLPLGSTVRKEVTSKQKQTRCEKSMCEIQGGSQEIMAISVDFSMFHYNSAPNSPELSLLKFLLLAYHHSHFLATTLDFTSFFTMAFLGATLFHSWAVFGLDFNSFCNCMLQNWHIAIKVCCYLSYFSLCTGRYRQCSTCVSCILF